MLSKIENGGISPSLSTLQAISGKLQVPLSSLFASFEERQDCSYVPSGGGLTIERKGYEGWPRQAQAWRMERICAAP